MTERSTDRFERGTQPRALLFDLGGVLIDIDFRRVLAALAPFSALSPDELRRRAVPDDAYARHERGELGAAGYFEHVRQLLSLNATDAQIATAWNAVFVGVSDETLGLLRRAARCLPCFLLSNTNPTHEAVWRARYAAVLAPLSGIFASSSLGARKPEPAAFETVSAATGFALRDMLFFDDSEENVRGALDIGLPAVRVRTPEDVRRALVRAGVIASL